MNGYLIFACSYLEAGHYSIGLQYSVNETWTCRLRERHATALTTPSCLSLIVNAVGSSPILGIL